VTFASFLENSESVTEVHVLVRVVVVRLCFAGDASQIGCPWRVNSNDNVTESVWFLQMIMLPWQGVSVATGSSMYYVRAVRKIACSLVSMVRRNSRGLIMR